MVGEAKALPLDVVDEKLWRNRPEWYDWTALSYALEQQLWATLDAERERANRAEADAERLTEQNRILTLSEAQMEQTRTSVVGAAFGLEMRAVRAEARVRKLVAALSTVLGIGHNLRAFAGTMLRWNEPGVNFMDEAARIVALAEKFHITIVEALKEAE